MRFPPGNARGSVRLMQLPRVYLLSAIALITFSSAALAQDNAAPAKSDAMSEVDGSDLSRQLRDRADKIAALTDDEREKLRLAHLKAMDDPAVKAALAKRAPALQEFRAALRESMLKAEPSLEPLIRERPQQAEDAPEQKRTAQSPP